MTKKDLEETFIMLVIALIVILMATSYIINNKYKLKVDDMDIIQIYDCNELTADILENRSEEGKIIIERIIGTVVDDDGNGKVMYPQIEGYDYISYKYTKGVEKGNVVLSYMIYNPDTDYVDDIIDRFDYIIS